MSHDITFTCFDCGASIVRSLKLIAPGETTEAFICERCWTEYVVNVRKSHDLRTPEDRQRSIANTGGGDYEQTLKSRNV